VRRRVVSPPQFINGMSAGAEEFVDQRALEAKGHSSRPS
jgi:hypothetical protein